MIKFKELNVNPKNRKTGDCSTRALVGTLGISYDEALKLQYEEALKSKYDFTSKEVMEKILNKFGYIKIKQPKKVNGKKYLISELDLIIDKAKLKEGVFITVANHHTCIKDGFLQDTWDCSDKTVGNYYIKSNSVNKI